jgi:hypothetical protein
VNSRKPKPPKEILLFINKTISLINNNQFKAELNPEEKPEALTSDFPDSKKLKSGLKNKRGKIYKRSDAGRLKISQSHKARKTKPVCGIKKGQTGPSHPSYKHGLGKTRGFDAAKNSAWIQGVKIQCHFPRKKVFSRLKKKFYFFFGKKLAKEKKAKKAKSFSSWLFPIFFLDEKTLFF